MKCQLDSSIRLILTVGISIGADHSGNRGLKPDVGHEVLWVLRDCLSGEVLLARSLLSEAEEELVALLQEVQALVPVPITGVISDGQTGLRHAVAKVFPTLPHQLCQYHYLREAAKSIYEAIAMPRKTSKRWSAIFAQWNA